MMITFRLMIAVDPDLCFEETTKWNIACVCRVKDTGNHASNWSKAAKLFRVKAPHIMKDFGSGWIAIVEK